MFAIYIPSFEFAAFEFLLSTWHEGFWLRLLNKMFNTGYQYFS